MSSRCFPHGTCHQDEWAFRLDITQPCRTNPGPEISAAHVENGPGEAGLRNLDCGFEYRLKLAGKSLVKCHSVGTAVDAACGVRSLPLLSPAQAITVSGTSTIVKTRLIHLCIIITAGLPSLVPPSR